MLDEDEFRQTLYYKEFYEPHEVGKLLTVKVIEDYNRTASCTVTRVQAYEQEDIDKFREICPHIRRVMTISDLIDRKTVERDCLAEVIDALAVAVILVDINMRGTRRGASA